MTLAPPLWATDSWATDAWANGTWATEAPLAPDVVSHGISGLSGSSGIGSLPMSGGY